MSKKAPTPRTVKQIKTVLAPIKVVEKQIRIGIDKVKGHVPKMINPPPPPPKNK